MQGIRIVQQTPPRPVQPRPTPPAPSFWSHAFRPFFLLAPLWGALSVLSWVGWLDGWLAFELHPLPPYWHGHEMIFGFAAAAAAGFLLTAVPSWSGQPPTRGPLLMGLAGLWALGRLSFFLAPVVPPWGAALLDLPFTLALALLTFLPVMRGKAYKHLPFPLLVLLLFAANVLTHLEFMGITQDTAQRGLYAGVDIMLLIIAVFGGRTIPMFIRSGQVPGRPPPLVSVRPPVEIIALVLLLLVVVADLVLPGALGGLLLLAAAVHLVRQLGWRPLANMGPPLVWVLHLGYFCLTAGLALRGSALVWGILDASTALHLHTVGAMGLVIMGIATRVSLNHTGRPLVVPGPVVIAYLLVLLAALVRVGGVPWSHYWAIHISGWLWIGAFSLVFATFLPILTGGLRKSA